jgi:hypothetical protein
MISPLYIKPVVEPMHSRIGYSSDTAPSRVQGQKYAVIHIKNITRPVGSSKYSSI